MKNSLSVPTSVSRLLLPGLLAVGLHAHSADGNGAFSDPVDAATLRAALVTGTSAGDDARYWECSVGDGEVKLHYRLLSDGTGLEYDAARPAVSSTFQWQTESATLAISRVDSSGLQNELSNIRFSDSDNMSLLVARSVPLSCVRLGEEKSSPDDQPAQASTAGQQATPVESATVSEQNRPIASYTYLEKSWVGFPATLTFTARVAYSFPNGYTVYCANWDPRQLDPTPGSVGQAVDDCDVKKETPDKSPNKPFERGQTIDISFGNVSASGIDYGDSSSSSISGSTLRMTHAGQIAIGKFNAFSVYSGGNGAGGGNRKRALVGSYALDGHLITIVTDSGEELVGFISWESNKGSNQIDRVFINGEHFWNRED